MANVNEPHLSHFNLKLNNAQAPGEVMNDFLDCTLENSLHLPDACTLRLHDAAFKWLDAATFREGVKVEVFGGEESMAELLPLFNGEVASLELDLAAHGVPTLSVRCFDRSHRLHRGRHQRSFVQMKDSDIVCKVGAEAGFNVQADATTQVHDWVFQNNQTNWEFLSERAERAGYRLFVQGERDLIFRKIEKNDGEPISLDWGKNLRSFRPRVSASPQVSEVVVRGWNPKTKEAIVGKREVPAGTPNVGESATGGQVGTQAFGAAKMLIADRPVHTQVEADDLARSICDEIGGGFLEADGLCYGQPRLRPGMTVKIANIGQRFSGQYAVTSTTHTYSPSEGYATIFSVNGKKADTLLALIQQGDNNRAALGGNIVVGIVTDNRDPQNQGRVKVKYPWLTEDHSSDWARQAAPMAGNGRGFYFLPEVDDEVLVCFEHGDIRRPYVVGALWNGKDAPVEGNDQAVSGGKVNRRSLKTRIGHTLLLDDTDGKGEMNLTTASGHVVTLDDANKRILAKTKSGHQVLLDDAADKIVVADKTGANKITIATGDNSVSVECLGDFSVNAKGRVSLQGMAGVDVNTPAIMTLQGSLVKIN